jgi:hypothetical protein
MQVRTHGFAGSVRGTCSTRPEIDCRFYPVRGFAGQPFLGFFGLASASPGACPPLPSSTLLSLVERLAGHVAAVAAGASTIRYCQRRASYAGIWVTTFD